MFSEKVAYEKVLAFGTEPLPETSDRLKKKFFSQKTFLQLVQGNG